MSTAKPTPTWPTDEEIEANDRLVKAAPKLLKVCEQYLAWHRREDDRECYAAIVDNMRAAVAKATGES